MISKKFSMMMFAGLVAVLFTLMPEMANAATGDDALGDIRDVIAGNVGTLIGLGIALLGLYTWLVQQSSWGVIMIVGGVAITAFPGIFSGMQDGFATMFAATGATDDTTEILDAAAVAK